MDIKFLKSWIIESKGIQTLLIFLCCCPVFFLAAVSYNRIYQEETSAVMERKKAMAFFAATIVYERLDAQVNLGVSLAMRPNVIQNIKSGEWDAAINSMENILKEFSYIDRIILYDPSGIIKAILPSGLDVVGQSQSDKDWYKPVSSHWQPYVSNVYQRGSKPRKNIIFILIPIKDDNKSVLGILQLEIPINTFGEWVEGLSFDPGEFIYILDYYGHIIYHPKFNHEKNTVDSFLVPVVQKLMRGEQGVGINYKTVETQQRIAAYRPVEKYGWGVVVTQPVEKAFMKRAGSLKNETFILGILLLFMYGMLKTLFYGLNKRKQDEDKINQLSRAVEQSPASIVITDILGNMEYVNPKFLAVTGYGLSEVIGQNPRILKSGEQSQQFYKHLWDTILAGKEWKGGFHNKKKNGELYWDLASISPIKDARGRITHFVAIKEDITAIKMKEETLLRLTKRFDLAKKSAQIGVWDWDVVNNIVVWDEQMHTLYGISKEVFKGFYETWKGFLHKEDVVRAEREVQEALSGSKDFDTEFRVLWPDGSIHYIRASGLVTRDSHGQPVRMTGINFDITDRKEAEFKVAEALNVKSDFISMVSHELRTPLTIIKEGVAIVADGTAGPLTQDQKDFLATAKNNVDRLARLINDVLDYQKLEAHYMKFQMVEQSLNDVVKEAGEGFKMTLEKKGLVLQYHLQEGLPKVNFDRDKTIQVLMNLIHNAMKFTEKGSIHLITEILGHNAVKVSVKDEGIGIKQEDLDRLFKSFSQLSTGMGRKPGGTGLGLALCRKIIEDQNGKIGVSSVWGQGSIFYFILPIKERRTGVGA